MSVGSIIGGGARLIRTQPRVVAIWGALYAVVAIAGTLVMRPFIATIMAMSRQTAANAAMGIKTAPVFPGAAFGNVVMLELLFGLLIIVAFAAVVRAVARPTGDRFAYLRVGMDELRLLGLGILLILLVLLVELVALVIFGILMGISMAIIGKTAGVVVGVIVGIVLFGAAIYAQVRLSLAGVLTVMQGRIVIKDAWRATKGHFWTLFGAFLLMSLMYLVATIVIIAITSPQLFSAYASMNPQAMQAAALQQYGTAETGISVGIIVRTIIGAFIAVPMGVFMVGGLATAAVEMGGVLDTVAAEFE
jgi:hypothetical protein